MFIYTLPRESCRSMDVGSSTCESAAGGTQIRMADTSKYVYA